MDITDSAQLLIFISGVNDAIEITQELAGVKMLRGITKSKDLFAAVGRVVDRNDYGAGRRWLGLPRIVLLK